MAYVKVCGKIINVILQLRLIMCSHACDRDVCVARVGGCMRRRVGRAILYLLV